MGRGKSVFSVIFIINAKCYGSIIGMNKKNSVLPTEGNFSFRTWTCFETEAKRHFW